MPKKTKFLKSAIAVTADTHDFSTSLTHAMKMMAAKYTRTTIYGAAGSPSTVEEPLYPFGTMLGYHGVIRGFTGETAMVIGPAQRTGYDDYIEVQVISGDREGTIQEVPLQTWRPIE